jgi:hypothetical protein
MSEVKLSLSIELPGRVMLSQEGAKALEQQGLAGFTKHSLVVEMHKRMGKKVKVDKETIHFKTRNTVPAIQNIKISKDAYNYMNSKECPSFSTPKDWSRMSKVKKLEAHLNEIAESRGGKVLHYHIFED